jgi:hypothetical protein
VKQAKPDYRATLAAGSLALTSGSTNELKIDFKRLRGFTNHLTIAVRDLPPGVQFVQTNLPAKDGSVSLQLVAEKEAPSFQGPIHIVVTNAETNEERFIPFELTTRGETGFAHLLVETSDDFWLTVRRKAAEDKKPQKVE